MIVTVNSITLVLTFNQKLAVWKTISELKTGFRYLRMSTFSVIFCIYMLYLCYILYLLRVIYNRPKNQRTPGESICAMLFIKRKGKIRKCSDTRRLLPDAELLKMKNLRAHYVAVFKIFNFELFCDYSNFER